ncbi:MAG: hypothetical protein OXN23_04990 [Gammaproteobacteria bacterium]|nr:hypothetical protein [Gammaproteobacteria bacterium]MDE0302397.1 hypothetical protein [Gammaproteobacteria bacterium]MDE0611514.1 hypothetical protein [Gammaproteobacteria bacterium]
MKRPTAGFHAKKLSRAGARLAELLEENEKPVVTRFEFFEMIRQVYRESPSKDLGLRSDSPDAKDYVRFRAGLKKAGVIGNDRDYGARVIRVLSVPDLPADGIIHLLDPTCYISHLSAMQWRGLTERVPRALMLTRPNREAAATRLEARMKETLKNETSPFPLTPIGHPASVRRRPIRIYQSKAAGACRKSYRYGFETFLSTTGQTFLDMLQNPRLCGGMAHVLDVWEEHALTYLDDIIAAVDQTPSSIAKCRAGYILEEYLGLRRPETERWKECVQRGGSRRLDPRRAFAPTFSETWGISLNA